MGPPNCRATGRTSLKVFSHNTRYHTSVSGICFNSMDICTGFVLSQTGQGRAAGKWVWEERELKYVAIKHGAATTTKVEPTMCQRVQFDLSRIKYGSLSIYLHPSEPDHGWVTDNERAHAETTDSVACSTSRLRVSLFFSSCDFSDWFLGRSTVTNKLSTNPRCPRTVL